MSMDKTNHSIIVPIRSLGPRHRGRDTLFIHALSENTVMLKIARNAGATVERNGSESDAYLKLPAATLATRLTEMVDDQIAEVDYELKQQAKNIWSSIYPLS